MQNHALKYLSLGFSIIPLRPGGKEPLVPWQEFQWRRASEQEVREWLKRYTNANLGIVTGLISGIVVVDLDGSEGIQFAQKIGIASPVQTITGNGKHLWYRYPKDTVVSSQTLWTGGKHQEVAIKSDGKYVVAPPSIHESGRRYRWLGSALNVGKLPIFPVSILEKFAANVSPIKKYKEEGWIAKALGELQNGNIDNSFTAILGRLRHDGYSADDARAFLRSHAERVGAEEGHLEEKIENIWSRYEPKRSLPSQQSGLLVRNDSSLIIHSPTNPDSIKQFEQLQLQSNEAGSRSLLCTGYAKLDQMLQGGLKSSRLFTIAARTGTGKTNWIIGVARTLCEAGKSVLIFSTETPYTDFWSRYIATLKEPREFNKHSLYVCDSFAPSVEKVEEAINEIKPDVFIMDHINHVSEDQKEISSFMQGLNFLRRKYDCAGIVTAQLNRQADWIDLKTGERVIPRMSMIKTSGTIEQASSRVLLLSETRVTPEGSEIVGNLDKNDNGPKGLIHFCLMNSPYKMVEL